MAKSRDYIVALVDEGIQAAKKEAPYNTYKDGDPERTSYDEALKALAPILTNALHAEQKTTNIEIIDGRTSLSAFIVQALKAPSSAAIKAALSNPVIAGVAANTLDSFANHVLNATPGGQAIEAIRANAKSAYTSIDPATKAITDPFFTDLAKPDPTTLEVKAIEIGIRYLAKEAKDTALKAADGKALSSLLLKTVFNPETHPTLKSIAKTLVTITDKEPDDTFDPSTLNGPLKAMAAAIVKINDAEALAQFKTKQLAKLDLLKKDIAQAITDAAQALKDAKADMLLALPKETKNELQSTIDALEPAIKALENLRDAEHDAIKSDINAPDSFEKANNAIKAISDRFLKLDIAKYHKQIKDAQQLHVEASKPPKPNLDWHEKIVSKAGTGTNAQDVLEKNFINDAYNVYEQLYFLQQAAQGDAIAHAKLKETEAKGIAEKIARALQAKIGSFPVVGSPPASTPPSQELRDAVQDMITRFDLLHKQMHALSEKKFEELSMRRYFSPVAPTPGTVNGLRDWQHSFSGGTLAVSGSTDPKDALLLRGTGGEKTLEPKVALKSEVRLYPKSADGFNYQSSVYYEKETTNSYEFGLVDLGGEKPGETPISDRGLLVHFLKGLNDLNKYTFHDGKGEKLDNVPAQIEKLVYGHLPPVLDPGTLKTFFESHLQVQGKVFDPNVVKDFMEYLKNDEKNGRTQMLTYMEEPKKSGGDFEPARYGLIGAFRKIKVTVPCQALLEQAEIILNTILASGRKSIMFGDCANKQLVLAILIKAEIAGMKVDFPFGSPKPTPQQITAVKAAEVRSNKSDIKYISGLTVQVAPTQIIKAANDFVPKVQGFTGDAKKEAEKVSPDTPYTPDEHHSKREIRGPGM